MLASDSHSGQTRLATAWQALDAHYQGMATRHMRELFAEDPQRFAGASASITQKTAQSYTSPCVIPRTRAC